MRVAQMSDPATAVAGGIIAKLLPAGIGAALMVAVDPPETKTELFGRVFVAFAASYLLGEFVFDFLQSFSLFSFMDYTKRAHVVAVDGIVGALGWFILGGASMMLKKFRNDPVKAVEARLAGLSLL
jgi:hypothetical protein